MRSSYRYDFVKLNNEDFIFEFKTVNKLIYQLIFKMKSPQSNIFILDVALSIDNPNGTFSRDYKIEKTVKNIIKQILKLQPTTNLLFCCYNGDNKGHKRKLLFDRWFNNYKNKNLLKYYCREFSNEIPDAFIIGVIDNPLLKDVITGFKNVGILFEKE